MLGESAVSSLNSDIHLKHWHLLSAEILAWTLAWIKITFIYPPLSLCASITFSQVVLPQAFLWWCLKNYLSQDSCPRLYQKFSLHHMILHPKYSWCSRKSPSLGKETFQLGQSNPSKKRSAHDYEPLTTFSWLHSNGFKFGHREQILFTTFTLGLYQESAFLQQTTQGRLSLFNSLGRWTICLVHVVFRNWLL